MSFILENFTSEEIEQSKNLVNFINDKLDGRICISTHTHILFLLKKLMGDKCKVYCETGSLFGGSLALVMQEKTPSKKD